MQSYSVCPKSILEKLPHERQNYDFLWIVFMLKNNVVIIDKESNWFL
jgi:hypothetical protein